MKITYGTIPDVWKPLVEFRDQRLPLFIAKSDRIDTKHCSTRDADETASDFGDSSFLQPALKEANGQNDRQ